MNDNRKDSDTPLASEADPEEAAHFNAPAPAVPAPIRVPRWTVGLAAGVGASAVLVFALAYGLAKGGADSDTADKTQSVSPLPAPGVATSADAQRAHSEGVLSPDEAQVVAALRQRLERDPSDLAARKELAVTLARNEQYMAAFREAEVVLAAEPDDSDALWVEAVVRLRMGQNLRALEILDRVLASDPSHLAAVTTKGLALLRMGDSAAAVAVWEEGLLVSGGSDPELQRLLAVSRSPAGPGGAGASSNAKPSAQAMGSSELLPLLLGKPEPTGR